LQNLPKLIEKTFKIYTAKILNHTCDFLVLGTNKGIVVLRFNNLAKPDVIACNKLIELNDSKLIFYYLQNPNTLNQQEFTHMLVENKLIYNQKTSSIYKGVFESNSITNSNFNRFKIDFSYDGMLMSALDRTNNAYTIFILSINQELKYSFKPIKYGKTAEIEWCPYDYIYAIIIPNNVNLKFNEKEKDKRAKEKYLFTINIMRVTESNIQTIYTLEE
jgi:hypothetical protein